MNDFHFTKSDRLLKRLDFIRIFKSGQKRSNRLFIAAYCPSTTGKTRLGITASKKTGNAVKRNKIKRLSREFFRTNRHLIQGGWDINLIARQKAASAPSARIFESLKDLFQRIAR